MLAWRVLRTGEPGRALEQVEVAAPEPPDNCLRVRMLACGLGLPDLLMCRGSYPLTPPLPFTPGQELCGVVSAVGEGTSAQIGDRVLGVSAFFLGHGGFAEEALALDAFCFPVPDSMDDASAAAFFIPFHTAQVGLYRRAALGEGETLLVLGGAGGCGSAAIQLGRARGATVIATARGEDRAAFCRELGADLVVDPREDLPAQVRERTQGRGADVVFDPVGGDAFEAATRCVAHEGRILLVGFASGSWGRPDPGHMTTHNYSVLGVVPSGYERKIRQRAQDELVALFETGRIRVPVDATLAFDALPAGLEALASGRVKGKQVLLGLPDGSA